MASLNNPDLYHGSVTLTSEVYPCTFSACLKVSLVKINILTHCHIMLCNMVSLSILVDCNMYILNDAFVNIQLFCKQ